MEPNKPLGADWRTVVDLEGMTWGDLRKIVELTEDQDDEDPVEFEWSDYTDVPERVGIVLRGAL